MSRYPPSLPRGASDGGGAACVEASLPMPLWHCRFFFIFLKKIKTQTHF